MDALERIGLSQLRENMRFKDAYDSIEGKLVISDLVDLPAQLDEIGGMLQQFNLPTFLKNYDIVGIIIRAMVGQYMKHSDKFVAISNDEIAQNEYKRRKQDLINSYLKEEIDKEIEIRLIEQGIDPDRQEFQSQEEQQAYIEEIRARKQSMAPPEIDEYMAKGYSTNFVRWANLTLKQDAERFHFDELDKRNLIDFLLTGRCFRHYQLGWDYYKPEYWSPLDTFFSQDMETRHIEQGEYVGRVHFYTPSQVLNKYGEFLSEKQIKKLLNGNSNTIYDKSGSSPSYKKIFESNFSDSQIVPHEGYNDYNFMLQVQDFTGSPVGESQIVNKEGETVKVPSYLPYRNQDGGFSPNLNYARAIRNDLNLRSDLLQVTEAYWEGTKRVGELTYAIPETGRIEVTIITEDLLEDFIRDNDIKKLTNISLEDHANKSLEEKVNTIAYTYVPVTCEGVKVSVFNRDASEDMYIKCREQRLQLKGDGNVYNNKLPVAGIVDVSLYNIIRPFQIGFNLSMNTVQNLSEKEIGILFLFDMSMLPAEFKNFGDSVDDVLVNLVDVARKTGFFPIDASRQNTQGGGGFNQFATQNLSLTPQIQNAMAMANMYKAGAYEQIGINPQMLGAPTKYETAGGVQVSQDASYAQIENYFDVFGSFKKAALEMHLNVAQYAKKNGKDITVFYTDSDMTTAMLEFTDESFSARKLNIFPSSNARKRRELEEFKNYIKSTNTLADDTIALAEFIQADTTKELIAIAQESIKRQQETAQTAHERQMEQIKATAEANDALNERNFQRTESSKNKDRIVDLQVAEINKAGKESNTNFQKDLFNQINAVSSNIQKEKLALEQQDIQKTEVQRKIQKDGNEEEYRDRVLNLKERELDIRDKQVDGKRFSDIVNKN